MGILGRLSDGSEEVGANTSVPREWWNPHLKSEIWGTRICRGLAADEAGVEGAGEAGVGGALDEGAAVGEDGEGVGRVGEAEEEAVGACVLNLAEALETGFQLGEIQGVVVLVDLDGVAAAEGDVGALVSGEGAEDALVADFAVGAGGGGVDFGAGVGP